MCCFAMPGCGDPIYDAVTFSPEPTEIKLSAGDDATRYEWPLSGGRYVIAKPPPMAYVTKFKNPISVPDRVTAELVSWSDEELDPVASRILHDAYDPPETAVEVVKVLPAGLVAAEAFDVSSDGERLITVEEEGLGLYKMADGSRIGLMKWPEEVGDDKIINVRFALSGDILIASEKKFYRIGGSDGRVKSQCDGCGEIAMWEIARDSDAMVVLNMKDRLFGGFQDLSNFKAYPIEEDLKFPTVGLSHAGRRFSVWANGMPRVYTQDKYSRITGHQDFPALKMAGPATYPWVTSGGIFDGWVNGIGLGYRHHSGKSEYYNMLWRPFWISSCYDPVTDSAWFLMCAGRYRDDGKEETIIFDFEPVSRGHSVGQILQEEQYSIRHSLDGSRIAMWLKGGLKIIHRRVWQSRRPTLMKSHVYTLVNQGKFDQLEKVHQIFSSQQRSAYGLSGGELAAEVTHQIAKRWLYLQSKKPQSEQLRRLQAWYDKGSPLALAASADRHYQAGWLARGMGLANTVTGGGWKTFQTRLTKASADLERLMKTTQRPCLSALETRVHVGLESGEGLEGVDETCRQATQLYPDNASIGFATCFKLLPQWLGEEGDAISFAAAHSRVLDGADSDLMYARLIGRMTEYVEGRDREGWASYDAAKVRRGVNKWIRRKLPVDDSLYLLHFQLHSRVKDKQLADQLLKYIVKNSPAPPEIFINGYFMRGKPGLYGGHLKLIGFLK